MGFSLDLSPQIALMIPQVSQVPLTFDPLLIHCLNLPADFIKLN
jgi:hypothetical protein